MFYPVTMAVSSRNKHVLLSKIRLLS